MVQFQIYWVFSGRLMLDLQMDLIDTRFLRCRTFDPHFSRPRVIGRLEPEMRDIRPYRGFESATHLSFW
tara:strand:- start:244 stop:450 length:207 start_codon:yes stop_codon:yes gene_type:complete